VIAVMAYEEAPLTVDDATSYYNESVPTAGMPIYDSTRERLLVGLSNMYRQNGGTLFHWGRLDGTARTRSSATLANLIDGSTTGNPTSATRGVHLDLTYRNTVSRTSVPFELAVYAQTAAGSAGVVRLRDTSGNNLISITNISTTAQWYTATGLIPASAAKYDLQFAGDGVNTLSVYAASVYEYEA
jgi:hypothetical protein